MTDALPYDESPKVIPGIGDNQPPEDADPLRDRMADIHGALVARQAALLADEALRVPEIIEDEEGAEKVTDYIKELAGCVKTLEGARVSEKEPFLKSGRTVDGFFKKMTDNLGAVKRGASKVLTVYEREKAERERRRLDEEARLAREEAERAQQEAEARADALADARDLDGAIEAEEQAKQAAADLVQVERDAAVNAAELSRTRSAKGAVSSLRTFWDFKELDRAQIDLEALRHHLPHAAIESAVRAFVKAGGRDLAGVEIFENTASVVR